MLATLEIRGFRNLEPATLELGAGGTLILGPNGAGKTSLLEAVYLLATTRSFRTPRLAECVRHAVANQGAEQEAQTQEAQTQAGDEAIQGDFEGFRLRGETVERRHLEMVFTGGERHRRLAGERVPLGRYLAALPVVAWTAGDLDVLVGPPRARRRFLDRGVVASRPASIDVITRYRRALGEKRRLLHRGHCSMDELMPWNLVLAGAAAELVRRRADYAARLARSLETVREICELDLPPLDLRYRPSPKEALDGEEAIAAHLEADAGRERAAEMPLSGPHRDDLAIRWRGRPLRDVASAGERKAIGLLLTAAHGRVLEEAGIEPVYLLDDVDTELDEKRLAALWRHFHSARQLLASSNRPFVWRELPFEQRLEASRGRFHLTP